MDWFWAKKVFLFDLDGTLYLGDKIIPGAVEVIRRLQNQNKDVFYFTNNSSRSDMDYVRKLRAMGFSCRREQVVMSTHTLVGQLKKDRIRRVFLLGTPAMKKMLKREGIEDSSRSPQAVCVGFDKTLTYARLEKASFLIHSGLPYYVAHPDYFCPTEKGPQPDCGSIALMLEKTTKKSPKAVMGKPHPSMIQEVQRRVDCHKSEMVLIGDRLMTDHLMAQRAKIDSVFVLSGDSSAKDLSSSEFKPRAVVTSVRKLL